MKKEIEYFDLRQVPNEFIVGAYNLASDYTLSDVDMSYKNARLNRFLLVINPNCLGILEHKKQQILEDYKKAYLALVNKYDAEKLLGNEFNKGVQDLQTKTRTPLAEHRQIEKMHYLFYVKLKNLIAEHTENLRNYSVIEIDTNPSNLASGYNIVIYPSYVFGIDKGNANKVDFYTKQEENALNSLIDFMYDESNPVNNTTPSENE